MGFLSDTQPDNTRFLVVKNMKQQQLFKVRDKRSKNWLWMDNDYLNGYARVFGAVGTAIYVSLCRHADNETQKCFPSQEKIAEELNITSRTVRKYLKLFEKHHLISIEKERDPITKKWINNVYTLLDKSEWDKPEEIISDGKPEENNDKSHRKITTEAIGNKQHNNNTHINNTNNTSYKEGEKSSSSYGNEDINLITRTFKETLGGSLDGTIKENRRFAHLLLQKFKKDYPDKNPVELVQFLIRAALQDNFHSRNATSFKYLYYNAQKIIQSVNREDKIKKGEWQCKYGFWHSKGEECGHGIQEFYNSKKYGQ